MTPERKKAPTIIYVPGMDLHKENGINYMNNPFVRRGMNCLAIDGPGQGESLMRKIWVNEENYGRAGTAAIDYLVNRPEVDPEKIGIHGTSFGLTLKDQISDRDRFTHVHGRLLFSQSADGRQVAVRNREFPQ